MMSNVNNNAFEVDPSPRKKRKRLMECNNAFLNPALDILSSDDRMCNNIMEVAPAKRNRRSKSCESRISFENQGLEICDNKNTSNDLLRKELANVNKKLASILEIRSPIYQNNSFNHVTLEEKTVKRLKFEEITMPQVNSTPVGVIPKRRASFDLSFIDKISANDDSTNGEALFLDDDLNESNIMEIKAIDNEKLPKNPVILKSTNPFLNCQIDYDAIENAQSHIPNNFPFDIPVTMAGLETMAVEVNKNLTSESLEYNTSSDPEVNSINSLDGAVLPRRLFREDITDGSIQYIDDSSIMNDAARFGHSTLNEPINTHLTREKTKNACVFVFGCDKANKQSKILGCDVSQMSAKDIFNCRPNNINSTSVSIPNLNDFIQVTFKDNSQNTKCNFNKPKNKNLFSKIKDVFKHEKKPASKMDITAGNPYEVFRKAPVQEKSKKPLPVCFVNPALNLNTTDSEMEENINDRCVNLVNNFQITPMKKAKEMYYEKENLYTVQNSGNSNGIDLSDIVQSENTYKKQVRFDSTLHEKYITGNSFDSENHSGSSSSSHITQVLHNIDDQIDEFHNELDNCFNEKKIISQNI